MEKNVIDELKGKLEAQKKNLQEELKSFASEDPNLKHNWDTKYPNREDADKDESADDAQEYDNMLSVEHSLELKLKDVSLALEKMKESHYGACEKCGKDIEEERLQAVPEAKLCITCNNKK